MEHYRIFILDNDAPSMEGARRLPNKQKHTLFEAGSAPECSSGLRPDDSDIVAAKAGGTGLGLSITQQVIGEHAGTIEVSSTEAKGYVFAVDIPEVPSP